MCSRRRPNCYRGAYEGLVNILTGERGAAFDREHVRSQLHYGHANDKHANDALLAAKDHHRGVSLTERGSAADLQLIG
jgi:hypothetical protein